MSTVMIDPRPAWAGFLLGFGLGGFFDGILLHQILQWHHLLSALDGATFRDIRAQILADGLFHAAMYGIAASGLWLLWRVRASFAAPGSGRRLLGDVMVGFGAWHIVDAVLSHWLLGIHRIRMDVENRLAWDLLWFTVFGVAFLAAGWWLRRRPGGGGTGRVVAAALAAGVVSAGSMAALPPADATARLVLFGSGTTVPAAFAALAAVGGRPLWNDPSGRLWAVEFGAGGGDPRALGRQGARLFGMGLAPVGCLNWVGTTEGRTAPQA